MNIVLITAGIDDLTRQFHQLPGSPIAIIELDDWSPVRSAKMAVRSLLGRIFKNRFDSPKRYCRIRNLKYFAVPRSDKSQIESVLNQVSADLVITYRCPIVPTQHLQSLQYGAINLHHSLLPAFRGGDPLFWQVMHAVEKTGVTVHRLSDKVDAGDILNQVAIDRPKFIAEPELWRLLSATHGFNALSSTVQHILQGTEEAIEQPVDADGPKAPNGARKQWRETAKKLQLNDEQLKDVACFLGEELN